MKFKVIHVIGICALLSAFCSPFSSKAKAKKNFLEYIRSIFTCEPDDTHNSQYDYYGYKYYDHYDYRSSNSSTNYYDYYSDTLSEPEISQTEPATSEALESKSTKPVFEIDQENDLL